MIVIQILFISLYMLYLYYGVKVNIIIVYTIHLLLNNINQQCFYGYNPRNKERGY